MILRIFLFINPRGFMSKFIFINNNTVCVSHSLEYEMPLSQNSWQHHIQVFSIDTLTFFTRA